MTKYIITYTSYKQYNDREVYNRQKDTDKRMEQLKACLDVSNLKMRVLVD